MNLKRQMFAMKLRAVGHQRYLEHVGSPRWTSLPLILLASISGWRNKLMASTKTQLGE